MMRFMSKDKSLKTMTLFGIANEKQGISKPSLKDWMVCYFPSLSQPLVMEFIK